MANRTSVSLRQILSEIPVEPSLSGAADVDIGGIAIDSRVVAPGDLFVSLKGGSVDGHDYIPQAIANGAAAVAGERSLPGLPVPYVRLGNSRQALTWIAAAFYGFPARNMTVIGVTGTDGKTTTVNLIYQILIAAGCRAGMITTVNAVIGDDVLDTGFHVTTPDAHDMQRYLAQMVEAGLTHAVLETTSHGWAQHRVDACEFDIGVITNITHEHLDEHGSYENYRASKARLLESLERTVTKSRGNPRLAVINRDDSSYDFLNDLVRGKKVAYGARAPAEIRAEDIEEKADGVSFTAVASSFRVGVRSELVGLYNVSNCLAALAATTVGLGIAPEVAARGISALHGVPGRMERIEMGQAFAAVVDFAHTPNALRVTLEAGRRLVAANAGQGRLIAIFGSAGLRDKEKRRLMAETSAELADLTVLTAEDPRTESLDSILSEMAAGARSKGGIEGETFWRIADRGAAIRFALGLARPRDMVLACGKGHEQSMCFGRTEYPWDDRTAMRAALADLRGQAGPAMPYLPTRDLEEAEWLKR